MLYKKTVFFNIYLLQFYSVDYQYFLTNNINVNVNANNINLINENKRLRSELNNYKLENEQLKHKINKLMEDNNKLNNELIKANNNNPNYSQINDKNTIVNLNKLVSIKEKEINDLKMKLNNNSRNENEKLFKFDDIVFVHFLSLDQKINCGIKCLKTDTFAEVEEKLYKKYRVYRETNNYFIIKSKVVLRFKKICENNIEDGDIVQLMISEDISN